MDALLVAFRVAFLTLPARSFPQWRVGYQQQSHFVMLRAADSGLPANASYDFVGWHPLVSWYCPRAVHNGF